MQWMKTLPRRAAACLLIACLALCLCAPRAQAERTPGETAMYFAQRLQADDMGWAARFCLAGADMALWQPPAITRFAVYPSMADIAVAEESVTGDSARVTLSFTAVDLSDGDVLTDIAYTLSLDSLYQADLSPRVLNALIFDGEAFRQSLGEHRRAYNMPLALRCVNEIGYAEWLIDLPATLALWPDAPAPALTAQSFGLLSMDRAQLSYYISDAETRDLLVATPGADYAAFRYALTPKAVFRALGLPVWNTWLRLHSDIACEGLYGFAADAGACAPALEKHYDYSGELDLWYTAESRDWVARGDGFAAVLTAQWPVTESDILRGTATCRQRVHPLSPLYFERALTIALDGAAYDAGAAADQVAFTAQTFTRLREGAYETASGNSKTGLLLRDLLENEYDGPGYASVWLSLPEDIGELPIENDRYALYRIQGAITKAPGGFGVYGVTFSCDAPDVWVENFEECTMCWEIDAFDLLGADSTLCDCTRAPFDVMVLLPVNGRTEAELDEMVRGLPLRATFSGEEVDYCYEQHGTTTRLGPRVTLEIDTAGLTRWAGGYYQQPAAEYTYADSAP